MFGTKSVCVCFFSAGNGPCRAAGGAAHRDGAGMGGSIHFTNETHTHHINDAGVVR